MSDDPRSRSVPRGRLSRFSQFGRLAGGVAGGMAAEAARRIASGERPRTRDLMLTPANVGRVADRLSELRGAAMKIGQMVSMDSGDLLPPELAAVLARLRDNAHHMPPEQLDRVLAAEWGKGWRTRFTQFDPRPIAAASIGQVHKAVLKDGRTVAIKVQYPGVRESIDADVDNVATLLRLTGLMPKELDIAPLLAEAKAQLHEEADYVREAAQMARFGSLLSDDMDLILPAPVPELTTAHVLGMTFVAGRPIEALENQPQAERDRIMALLIRLVARELFVFGAMQTDPNFANYRYQPGTDGNGGGKLVLLDFGAARDVRPATAEGYRRLVAAGLAGDRDAVRDAAVAAGFVAPAAVERHRARIDAMIDVILTQFAAGRPFDFADRAFIAQLRDEGMAIGEDRASWHLPPAELLFVQRKLSGTALLAARMKAVVDVRAILAELGIGAA